MKVFRLLITCLVSFGVCAMLTNAYAEKQKMTQNSESTLKIGGVYRHYKGKMYEVIGVCYHTETLEKMVVYRGLYTDKEFGKNPLWVRPLTMFLETVEYEGQTIPRFTFISEENKSDCSDSSCETKTRCHDCTCGG